MRSSSGSRVCRRPQPAASPSRRALPTRLGHYKVTGKLGEGGMGIVYAARDERLDRTVALKMMSSMANDESARAAPLARGARRGERQPSQHLSDLRDRRRRGRALHRDGAARGRGAVRAPAARRRCACRRRRRSVSACSPRSRPCTRAESSIAISSRRTCSSRRTASSCSTSVWRVELHELTRGPGAYARPAWSRHAALHGAGAGDAAASMRAPICSRSAPSCSRCSHGRPAFGGRHDRRRWCTPTVYNQPPALGGHPAIAAVDRPSDERSPRSATPEASA